MSRRGCNNCGWYAHNNVCTYPKLNGFCNILSDWKPEGKCVDCAYEIGKYGICNSCICYSKFEPKGTKPTKERGSE